MRALLHQSLSSRARNYGDIEYGICVRYMVQCRCSFCAQVRRADCLHNSNLASSSRFLDYLHEQLRTMILHTTSSSHHLILRHSSQEQTLPSIDANRDELTPQHNIVFKAYPQHDLLALRYNIQFLTDFALSARSRHHIHHAEGCSYKHPCAE